MFENNNSFAVFDLKWLSC